MTRDEAIRLVKESGLHISQEDGVDEVLCRDGYHLQTEEVLELVRLACAAEREACALQVLEGTGEPVQTKTLEILRVERQRIADAIRARSRDGN